MRIHVLSLIVLSLSTSSQAAIKHISPLADATPAPATCVLVGVLPGSPAEKAGLHIGDTLQSVNGTKPADALAVADLIDHSGAQAQFETVDSGGRSHAVPVSLNKEKPRLGASCDLSGWSQKGVSSVGNESLTMYQGPYVLTVSGIFDKGLAFMRVRVSNHSATPLAVSASEFSALDGSGAALPVLSPKEVMYFLHGPDGLPYLKSPGGTEAVSEIPADSPVRRPDHPHKSRKDWSHSDEDYAKTNGAYLGKESLWPSTVEPGKVADGLIYFMQPAALPFAVQAHIESATFSVRFGDPLPSAQKMSQDELAKFFEGLKKGAAVRLTLKKGTVFSGKYSSFDADNEIVWFDTPSGVLLTTTSFGLRTIAFAEVLIPEKH